MIMMPRFGAVCCAFYCLLCLLNTLKVVQFSCRFWAADQAKAEVLCHG